MVTWCHKCEAEHINGVCPWDIVEDLRKKNSKLKDLLKKLKPAVNYAARDPDLCGAYTSEYDELCDAIGAPREER